MGTLLGPKLQAPDPVLTEWVPIYTSCEIGQPLCYAILLLLTVNALVFIKMCFRQVNIEEIYTGIFLSWWLRHCWDKRIIVQINTSSNEHSSPTFCLTTLITGHWKSRRDIDCPSVKIWWLLNSLTCLQQKVPGKFDPSPCRFWAVQNHGLANFLFVLLVSLNPVLLYCCARTTTYKESFKK